MRRLHPGSIGVTGGRGALGRRLCERLIARGLGPVHVVDIRPAPASDGLVSHAGSIADAALLNRAFRGLATVIHLAGLADATGGADRAVEYFALNVGGTADVMDAVWRQGVARVVFASTGHVYGAPEYTPVDERHPVRPGSIYAASKAAAEHVVSSCAQAGGASATIARFSNLYGAPFLPTTVVGRLLHAAAAGQALTVRNTFPIRDFLHVDDAVEALVELADADVQSGTAETVNVSTGRGTSVGELRAVLATVGAEDGLALTLAGAGEDGTEPVPELVLSPSRMRELTAWSAKLGLREGLRQSLRELRQARPGVPA